MKVAIVVQRYGADINGGAELHARYLAEHLARHLDVEVLTSCARDYVRWRNETPAGPDTVNGVPVRRFPVTRERDPDDFGRRSARVFEQRHSLAAELAWLESEGPTSPSLVRHLGENAARFDYCIFFSYRYYHSYHGIRTVSSRAILVPTAERDPAIGLSMFGPIFRGARALMYNSHEERAMIEAVSGNTNVPGIIVGVGSEIPERCEPDRFRQRFGIDGRFAIYVGRIDENKGCKELFHFFERYSATDAGGLTLVLVGSSILPVPSHPRIRHVGFLGDDQKFDAIAAADLLIMPSYLESLSMVAIEAWGLGRPVLANGKCDVLRGQCIRSNAGLYYENYEEFSEALDLLIGDQRVKAALGRNGRAFFQDHYAWPVIERKYLEMFDRLRMEESEGRPLPEMTPLPGWLQRFRRRLPPANEVLAGVPAGPVVPPKPETRRASVVPSGAGAPA